MHKNEFRFLNGVAEIIDKETGQVLAHQPFKPMDASHGHTPQPWDNEEEAYSWAQANFGHHLEELHPDFIPQLDIPEPIKNGTVFNPDGSIDLIRSQRLWSLHDQGIDPADMTTEEIWDGVITPEEVAEQKLIDEENKKLLGTGN